MIQTPRIALAACLLLSAASGIARSADCSRGDADRSTVPEIAAHPEQFEGRCVVIDGVMSGHSIYETVDGVYLRPREYGNPASSGFQLGLDGLKNHATGRFRHVSIVGRVQDCETVRDSVYASAGKDEIVMVAGYCHYFDGAYVYVHDVSFREGTPFTRQMGRQDRKDYGDIEPAPANWPHREKIEALADTFVAALRANDRDTLANIHFRNVGLEWEDEEPQLLKFLLKATNSPFASLRRSVAPPQRIILVEKPMPDPDEDEEEDADEQDGYSAIVCFCRTRDCSGRWPIARFDADNLPSRPYACTDIHPYLADGETVPHFSTEMGRGGLAEPD